MSMSIHQDAHKPIPYGSGHKNEGENKMKKFSVLMVALIVALMLFVSCEQKIPERAATDDDVKVYTYYQGAFGYVMSNYKKTGVFPEGVTGKVDMESQTAEVSFSNYKIEIEGVKFVLNGTAKKSGNGSSSIDITKGSSINGTAHTLKVNVSVKDGKPVYDVIIDGTRITGLEKY